MSGSLDPNDQPPIHPPKHLVWMKVQETWPVRIVQVFFETMDQQMQVIASAQQNPVLKRWWWSIFHVNCQTAGRFFDPLLVPLFDRSFVSEHPFVRFVNVVSLVDWDSTVVT